MQMKNKRQGEEVWRVGKRDVLSVQGHKCPTLSSCALLVWGSGRQPDCLYSLGFSSDTEPVAYTHIYTMYTLACICMHAKLCVWLFVTPRTVAR